MKTRSRLPRAALLAGALLLSGTLSVSSARAKPAAGSDADREVATKVLFGWGVAARHDKRAGKIQLDYDAAKLDAATLQRYLRDYFRPAVANGSMTMGAAMMPHGWFLHGGYAGLLRRGGLGWLLYEPYGRLQICKEIARRMSSTAHRQRVVDRCWMAAALQATRTIYEFRGAPVSWSTKRNYGGSLRFADKLWPRGGDGKLQPLVLVPGFHRVRDPRRIRVQQQLAKLIKPRSRYYRMAQKLLAANRKWIAAQEAKVRRLEKRQAGRSGRKVIFASRPFGPWSPVEAERKPGDCATVYWKAFGPTGRAAGSRYYDWAVFVDGKECRSDFFGGKGRAIVSGGPIFTAGKKDCSKRLLAVGRHEVEVRIYATRHVKTGEVRVRLRGKQLSASHRYASQRTHAIARGRTTCRTKDETLRQRYVRANP